jgi:hypothetical protein
MAQMRSNTQIVKRQSETEIRSSNEPARKPGQAWQITFCEPHNTSAKNPGIPEAEEQVIWQGRPPFPGTMSRMPKS